MDIHRLAKRVEAELRRVDEDEKISKGEKKNLKRYTRYLLANVSYGRVAKYLQTLRKLCHLLGKPFEDATKDDFVELVTKIEANRGWTDWTKHDFKVVLRRYYRWLRGLGDGEPFPEEVRWIRIAVRNAGGKLPKDVLTEEEVQRLVRAAKNPRDRAFILALYESGCRIGEFLPIKIRDLEFDANGCVLYVGGKTGNRRVRLVASTLALQEWLENHPQKNDPNAHVWIQLPSLYKPAGGARPLCYGFVRKMLKGLAGEVGIAKPVNPHAFRHARATHLANHLTEASSTSSSAGPKGLRWPACMSGCPAGTRTGQSSACTGSSRKKKGGR
jgi:integrase